MRLKYGLTRLCRETKKMICPNCENVESFVMHTDAVAASIKRRRVCYRCHHRWNTYETAENVMGETVQAEARLGADCRTD